MRNAKGTGNQMNVETIFILALVVNDRILKCKTNVTFYALLRI